jgi:phage minor structural protein
MIRVYDPTERQFNHNGLKVLNPLFAEILKVDNGDYYIELEDMLENLEYYQKGMIIRVTTPWGVQGFRCDNPIIQNNRISCKAWHLSYDSENYIINEASAIDKNCNDALNHYNDNTDTASPFTVISDIPLLRTTEAVRKPLFAVFVDLLSAYGGHWERDNFTFGIRSSIGQDRGVVLAYNKNITDIKVEEIWDNVCTKLLPYVKDGDEEITLDEIYIEADEHLYDIPYTKAVEFKYEEREGEVAPSSRTQWQEWLHNQALMYLEANKYPQVNYSVSARLDNISDVGDIIYVKHPKCNVDILTNVISVKYDAIRGRYTAIEFGNFKKEIKSLVNEVASLVEADSDNKIANNNALLQAELGKATAEINSVLSGSNVINSGNEILIVDRLPKEEAVYCLKINRAGIGFSKTGIYGTFTSAWTIDGTLNMQAINVINLTASLIKGGTLKLGGTNNTSGTFELYDNSNKLMALMDRAGLTVYAQNGDYVKLNAEVGFAGYNKNGTKVYWADGDVFRMKNAEVENEIKIAGKIKVVPVSTSDSVGVGFVALN